MARKSCGVEGAGRHDRQRDEELKQQFWDSLADSPYLFLQLDSNPATAVPMTAALDENASGAIWFFTGRDHAFARGGAATANFAGKGHDVFARFKGTLAEETSRERLDKEWSNFVEAYFPRGKDDPNLLMLRMDLGDAEIWTTDVGLTTTVKMALGRDVRGDTREQHAETALYDLSRRVRHARRGRLPGGGPFRCTVRQWAPSIACFIWLARSWPLRIDSKHFSIAPRAAGERSSSCIAVSNLPLM